MPNKQGKAAWYDASVNPISTPAEGQTLLDTAYLQGETQAFNVRLVKDTKGEIIDRQIIRFHYENRDKKFHAYELSKKFNRTIETQILRNFKKDGLITENEYRKMTKNKWKK